MLRKNKNIFFLSLIVLLTLPACFSLFKPYLFLSMDGIAHVARFAGFMKALQDGQLIPAWINTVSFGLGSPVLMYGGFLPYLLTIIPRLFGASLTVSIKIILGLGLVGSGISFYFFAKEIFEEKAAFLGALAYIWVPYRFVDIFVRGAYPECLIFLFIPLLFLAIIKYFQKENYLWLVTGSLAMAAILLSHNAIALMYFPLYPLFGLIMALTRKNFKGIIAVLTSAFLALLISAFSWLPAFVGREDVNLQKLSQSYSHLTNFVPLTKLVYSKWGWSSLDSNSPMSLQLGIPQIIFLVIGLVIIVLFLMRSKLVKKMKLSILQKSVVLLSIATIAITVFLINPASAFLWNRINLLAFILYPWRFLAVAVFFLAVMASFVSQLFKNNRYLVAGAVFLLLFTNINHIRILGINDQKDGYYEDYLDTTDMWGEYLPKDANLEAIKNCKLKGCWFERLLVPKEVVVQNVVEKTNLFSFSYSAKNDFKVTLNIFSFPGWHVFLDDKALATSINPLGTMDFNLPKDSHFLAAKFETTPIRKLSEEISLVSALVLLSYVVWKSLKTKFFSS